MYIFSPNTIIWEKNSSYTPRVWNTTIVKTIVLFNFKSEAVPWRPFKLQAECCAPHTQWEGTLFINYPEAAKTLVPKSNWSSKTLSLLLNTTDFFLSFFILAFSNHRTWLPIPANHILFSVSASSNLTCRAQPPGSLTTAPCGHF